jgi:hypothetical protein
MSPVTVAKIMVPASGTKIAQDSHSPWFTTARIRNSTETPTMRFERTNSILWPALATTAAMIAVPNVENPRIWSTAIRATAASSPGGSTGSKWRCRSRAIRYRMGTVLVLSDDWNGPWVQVDGDAEVLHMPDAADGLVDYFRCISGEHPDWEEYREAMRIQDKSLIRITPTRWGPIATGGFPADVAARLDS